ncbi:hypothetical protein GF312_12010 [Candidatus Poribacteria bacterium]|nr:hypothetical protein [Candidatus Poribacteria bacterium]
MLNTEYKGNKYIALLKEISSFSTENLFFRVNYELSKKLGKIEKKHPPIKLSEIDITSSLDIKKDIKLKDHFIKRKHPHFFFNPQNKKEYQKILRKRFKNQKKQVIKEADEICQDEFTIFDSYKIKFDDKINWHFSPDSDKTWPKKHWSKINIRGKDRIGDVKYTWELNRHQFFFVLGRAYWFTGDGKYACKWSELTQSWLDDNPPEVGINWYSNLEIALRIISWIWAYFYFLDSPYLNDLLHIDILRIILHSCRHITKDLSYSLHSMANNHVIGDTAGIVFAGIMFPEFRELRKWRDEYTKVMFSELEKQVYNDGVDFEQSTGYHRFVLYFYILIMQLMRINNYPMPDGFSEKIEKMTEFVMGITKPDGNMPLLGDCDNGKVVNLCVEPFSSSKPVLSTGAALFQRGDFRKITGELSEETLWFTGPDGLEIFDSLNPEITLESFRSFPMGGYYVMRTGWGSYDKYCLFKCGPYADHGHADLLHMEIFSGNTGILTDSGTYIYNGSWEWRTFFRSTYAHNTIVIDGESQSIPHRVFRWLYPAKSRIHKFKTSANFDYVDGEHSGYTRYKNDVTHRRSVCFVKPDYFVITDRLTGSGEHEMELLFHIPQTEYRINEYTKEFFTQNFRITPILNNNLELLVYNASEKPTRGWYSNSYGHKTPAITLCYKITCQLPKTLITVLYLRQNQINISG